MIRKGNGRILERERKLSNIIDYILGDEGSKEEITRMEVGDNIDSDHPVMD